MKSVPVWIWYTVLRVLLFIVPLLVLVWAGVDVWISAIVAALFGLVASLVFLRKQRGELSRNLHDARAGTKAQKAPTPRVDDEEEDAAVDARVHTPNTRPRPTP